MLPKEPKSATPDQAGFAEALRKFLSDIAKTKTSLVDDVEVSRFFDMRDKDGLGTITIPCEELKAALRAHSDGEFSDENFQQLLNIHNASKSLNFDSINSPQLIVNSIEFRQLVTNFMGMLREKSTARIKKMNTHQRLYNGSFSTDDRLQTRQKPTAC